MKKLTKDFFEKDTETAAKSLLGKEFVKVLPCGEILSGIIVETEAYLPSGDAACHAANKKTARNGAMFLSGGFLYVYKIYGIHHCINFVTEDAGRGCAVLLRALQPARGIAKMRENRGLDDVKKLCKGPGNVSKAFGFTLADNGKPLFERELYLKEAEKDNFEISAAKRVGIRKSAELPLRFYIKNNPYISKK